MEEPNKETKEDKKLKQEAETLSLILLGLVNTIKTASFIMIKLSEDGTVTIEGIAPTLRGLSLMLDTKKADKEVLNYMG